MTWLPDQCLLFHISKSQNLLYLTHRVINKLMTSFWLFLSLTWKGPWCHPLMADGQSSQLGRWGANVDTQRSLVTFERWITGASLGPQVDPLVRKRWAHRVIVESIYQSGEGGSKWCRGPGNIGLSVCVIWDEMSISLKWMVYNGKPYKNGWFGGTPIFGNTQFLEFEMKWMGLVDLNCAWSLIWHESKATLMDCSDDDQKSLPKMWVPNVSWRHRFFSLFFFGKLLLGMLMWWCHFEKFWKYTPWN